jgi:hypothetical protein
MSGNAPAMEHKMKGKRSRLNDSWKFSTSAAAAVCRLVGLAELNHPIYAQLRSKHVQLG